MEETGIGVRNPVLFATYDLKGDKDDMRHFFLSVFRVEADQGTEAIAADDAADPGWYTVEEIRNLPVPASVLECAERLAAEREGR
jgi:ADP-ribose pyrophosphatase YjhB (NUDIX family)